MNSLNPMLYKYHQINSNLTNLIENNCFWFSKPSEFNDPFDMRFFSNLKSTQKEIRVMREAIKANVKADNPNIIEKDLEAFLKKALELVDIDTNINNLLTFTLNRFGVCCFTETFDNLLMWSHYSGSHTGVCLEFDEKILVKIEKSWLIKIKYSNEFPIVNNTPEIEKALTTKSECWEYENEFRILAHKQGLMNFPKEALKSIIFGVKSDESQIKRIIKLVNQSGYKNIAFKKAKINEPKYQLFYDIIE